MARLRVGTVLAHPDDETFGLGGTLLRFVARGAEVHSLCLTRGEGGSLGDPDHPITTREAVGDVRAGELREAGRRMGLASVTVLDFGDGGMSGDRGLPKADPRAVEDAILEWLRAHPLDVLITWGPDGGYGHPDHVAAGERCVAALARAPEPRPARVYRFVIYDAELDAWRRTFPDWDILRAIRAWPKDRLDALVELTDAELDRKWEAMRAHRTQAPDLRNWETLLRAHRDALRHEAFIRQPRGGGGLATEL